jgi:amino acid transporter
MCITNPQCLVVIFHTRFSYLLSNSIGLVKVLTLVFIAITGFVVLGGHTSAHTTNFDHSFQSTSTTPYGLTNALYKIIFSYAGFENAFNVVNETRKPMKRIRTYGFISIFVVAVLYILANVAYFAAGEQYAPRWSLHLTIPVSTKNPARKLKSGRCQPLLPEGFRLGPCGVYNSHNNCCYA